jgi:hypothetical protein
VTERVVVRVAGPDRLTCGLCHREIERGEQFAAVLYEPSRVPDGPGWGDGSSRREVRHLGECAEWKATIGEELREGDLLWSHRFQLTDWGPRIEARVHKRTKEFNENGWRGIWLVPADPTDTSPLDKLRAIGETWAVKMADEIGAVNPEPRLVWISDDELVHLKHEEENA